MAKTTTNLVRLDPHNTASAPTLPLGSLDKSGSVDIDEFLQGLKALGLEGLTFTRLKALHHDCDVVSGTPISSAAAPLPTLPTPAPNHLRNPHDDHDCFIDTNLDQPPPTLRRPAQISPPPLHTHTPPAPLPTPPE